MTRAASVRMSLFLVLICHQATEAATADQVNALRRDLLASYNKDLAPVRDQFRITTVELSLTLLSINGFDMVTSMLSTTGYLTIQWKDEFLAWDKVNEYEEVDELYFPQNSIWKPDIALQNSFSNIEEMGEPFIYITVTYDGNVSWVPFAVFETNCDADITYFPFDRQRCKLTIVTWSFGSKLAALSKLGTGVNEPRVQSSGWTVMNMYANSTVDKIVFTIMLKRKPLTIIINILIPVVLMVTINMFVLLLPIDSGERNGLAVTFLLALTVFLTIVSDSIPDDSSSVSLLSVYILNVQIISALILIVTILNVRIHHRHPDRQPVTKRYTAFVRRLRTKPCARKSIATPEVGSFSEEDIDDVTWPDVAEALDIVFFWVFVVIGIVTTIILGILVQTQPDLSTYSGGEDFTS
jgi:hypothetical protein